MQANVLGRVRNMNLARSQALLPLFEAVINSIDAIEDAKRDDKASIQVYIKRRQDVLPMRTGDDDEDRALRPISGFEIVDNGIGFTDANYQAFDEADTRVKAHRGGKGVGRFLWLKAFDEVEVDSTYRLNGAFAHRTFKFSLLTQAGISDHCLDIDTEGQVERTVVRLSGFKEEYETQAPRKAKVIGQRTIEHCLEYFVLKQMPMIVLYDEAEDEPIVLWDLYRELVANTEKQPIEIKGKQFDVIHFMLHAHADLGHHLSYCADGRVAKAERLGAKIANLPTILASDGDAGGVIYAGYVASDYLDRHVNQQRTGFDTIPDDGLPIPDELSWTDIEQGVLALSKQFLLPYTDRVRVEKERRVRDYVNSSAPEYRHILKNFRDRLDVIPADVSDEMLERKLHEISREVEVQLRREAEELVQQGILTDDGRPYEEQIEQFSRFWEEYNDAGKAALAQYIVHRKYVLALLEDALKRQGTSKYSREEVVHRIVFPLKQTSDDVTYDQHNLWILDEKLAYHEYLSSDVPLNKVDILDTDSILRPDLLAFFHSAIAVVDDEEAPYGSGVVIFEFKRPMRDDYTDDENPIQQVYRYVRRIKAGSAQTKDGRPFTVSDHTPFYCYIVCDLTPRLREQAEILNLQTTPDGCGYFGYNGNMGAYVEVMSFDKLVRDAHKRNRILFDKLNLPDRLNSVPGKARNVRH